MSLARSSTRQYSHNFKLLMPATAELLKEGRYRLEPSDNPTNHSVQSAYDTVSDTKVVLREIVLRMNKVTTLSQQEAMKTAFAGKAAVLTTIQHGSILKVHDFFSEVGRQYLVLENVEGDDFQTLLETNSSPFNVSDVIAWADQLLDGVAYLHNLTPRIIHSRITPRSIRLSVDGKVKLYSHAVSDESGSKLEVSLADTGSPELNYSPLELIWDSLDAASQKVILNSYDDRSEKVLKQPADARSDIYSLGATLYHLLTGVIPVDPLERSIDLLEGNKDPLTKPHELDARIAPEVSDVIMRAMEIKRENRFDSAVIMRQVLRTAGVRVKERESAEGVSQPFQSQPEAPVNTVPVAVSAAAVNVHIQSELLEQKLREAEELRIQAEKRAAEAERLLKEQEAERAKLEAQAKAATHSSEPPVFEDDLLGLSDSAAPHAPVAATAPPATPERREPPQRAMVPEPAPRPEPPTYSAAESEVDELFDEEPESPAAEVFANEPEVAATAEPAVFQPVVEFEDEPGTEDTSFADSETYYDEPEKKGLPIPMIAGAVAVVLLLVVGGWIFLGGSAQPQQAEQPTQTQAEAPQQIQQQSEVPAAVPVAEPSPAQPESSFAADSNTQTPTQVAATETETSARSAVKTAATPAKPKAGTEPAKTPAPKKAVTVDDLISDN